MMIARRCFLVWIALLTLGCGARIFGADEAQVQRRLYVGCPGIRNYTEFGGQGLLFFDIDDGHRFVKRIDSAAGKEPPENIKGICAHAATARLFQTTPKKLYCLDLITELPLWERELPNGCDRMSMLPDGSLLYVPSFERETWNVVDAASGDVVAEIETKSGAHNTVVGLDGKWMYLAGLRSPLLSVADTSTHRVARTVGPFAAAIRPFTVNASQTRCYVCINELLGFEIGDLTNGQKLARIEVSGFEKGPVKRHGCPSHGIGLTPDETEIWLCDGHNGRLHIFDLASDPPRQTHSLPLREQPGWVTFSLDGRYAYPSTGEVFDARTKEQIAALADETGREVHSEKMVEIHFHNGKPVRVGDQFGVGRLRIQTTGQ